MANTKSFYQQLRNYLLWPVFIIYNAILFKIIVVKNTRFFMDCLRQTWRHGSRHQRTNDQNWQPFKTIKLYMSEHVSSTEAFMNIGGNILVFVPFGILAPFLLNGKYKALKTIFAGFVLSLIFECIQGYTGCGKFDVDDIILNTSGTIIGVLLYWILSHFLPRPVSDVNALV